MNQLRDRARKLHIRHITFPGPLWDDDKQALWDESDVFLHLCRYNGFALSVREAMGQGLPILTTRESDLGDWTHLQTMGIVVHLSASALAAAIIGVLNLEPRVFSAMSRNARMFAEQTTWSNAADICLAAYSLQAPVPLSDIPDASIDETQGIIV